MTKEQENCLFCHPYKEYLIEADNGFCCVTKNGEFITYSHSDEAQAVKIKIKFCPMCGRKLDDEILQNIFVECTTTDIPTADKIANISAEINSTKTYETDKIKNIKHCLNNLVTEFLKEQFPENSNIIEINFCTTALRTLIRCAQVIHDSQEWSGHEFIIYAETKEIVHTTAKNLTNIDAVKQFVSTGIVKDNDK